MYLGYNSKSMELGLPVILLFDVRNYSHIWQFQQMDGALKPAASKGFRIVAVIFRRRG